MEKYSDLKKEIIKNSKTIFDKHPEEKYRRYPKETEVKYPITNFIDFRVFQKSTNKNIKLQNYMFLPDTDKHSEIKGIVYMFHGMQDWAGTSAFIAQNYADTGCVVVAYDQRGHGYSQGYLGDIENFQYLIDDAKKFMLETEQYFKTKYKDEKEKNRTNFLNNRFLHGLSMGGLLCYYLSKDKPEMYKGVVLFAPAVDIHPGCFLRFLIRILGTCCSCLTIPEDKESLLSKNPYLNEYPDPMVERTKISFRTVKTTLDFMEESQKQFSEYKASFVIVIPGVDKMVPPITMFDLFEKSKSLDKDCWYYPNLWHEIDFEEEIFEIMKRLGVWVEKRLEK